MPTPTPIPFSTDIRPDDTVNAKTTINVALYPDEQNPRAVDFSGTCPRCGDSISIRKWLLSVAGASRMNDAQLDELFAVLDRQGNDRSHGDETYDLTCTCTVAHPKCPKDKHGCGASFRVRVMWP